MQDTQEEVMSTRRIDIPKKVPIQSPSQLLSIGFPSLQAEIMRYVPSSSLLRVSYFGRDIQDIAVTYRFENCKWTTGLVCPEHKRGCTLTWLFPLAPPFWSGVAVPDGGWELG